MRKAKVGERRLHPRLPSGSRVAIAWEADGDSREASGRCLDISVGGAKIEVSDIIPVASPVHVRFLDDVNFEAYGVVRNSSGQGSVGVEFTRMLFCGSVVRKKPRSLLARFGALVAVIAGLVLLFIFVPRIPPDWRPFTSKGVSDLMPLTPPSFTLGSTKADVQEAQGTPTTKTDSVWSYRSSRVHFRGDRVVGWSASPSTPLKVGANSVESAEPKRNNFTVGSAAPEVLAVQGPPTELTENVWRYGSSEVYFRDGRVVGWKNSPEQPLKVK